MFSLIMQSDVCMTPGSLSHAIINGSALIIYLWVARYISHCFKLRLAETFYLKSGTVSPYTYRHEREETVYNIRAIIIIIQMECRVRKIILFNLLNLWIKIIQ